MSKLDLTEEEILIEHRVRTEIGDDSYKILTQIRDRFAETSGKVWTFNRFADSTTRLFTKPSKNRMLLYFLFLKNRRNEEYTNTADNPEYYFTGHDRRENAFGVTILIESFNLDVFMTRFNEQVDLAYKKILKDYLKNEAKLALYLPITTP